MASKKAAAPPPQEDAATPPGQPPPPTPVQPVLLFKMKLDCRDVDTGGAQSTLLIEECRDVVSFNDLREGDTVECWGNFDGADKIRATFRIIRKKPEEEEQDQNQETAANKVKEHELNYLYQETAANKEKEHELNYLLSNDEEYEDNDVFKKRKEEEVPTRNMLTPVEDRQIPAVDLFEKKLDYADVHPGQGRLVFTSSSDVLKPALNITPRIGVSIVNSNNKVVHRCMQLMHYVVEDRYTLCGEWRRFVAENDLKVGDSVQGRGNLVKKEELRVRLYIRRGEPPVPSGVKTDEGRQTLLLLGKDGAGVLGRMVINSSSKEVAEVVVAREGIKMDEYDEGSGFARFSAEGANAAKYEWREAVGENGFEDGLVDFTRAAIDGAGNF